MSVPVAAAGALPAAGGDAAGAAEPTIGELLAPTGLPAVLDSTPAQLLDGLGLGHLADALPPLPVPGDLEIPDLRSLLAPTGLPALPVLPALDPLALLAPLGDLLRAFGTGRLPGGAGDPMAQLTGLTSTLQAGIGAATSAVEALTGLWSGQGASAAGIKSMLSAADAGALAAQGAAMTADIAAGLTVVGAGLAALQGVIVKTATLIAGTLPAIMTPPGQLAALAFAAEGVAEGMAVVTATRAQLAAPTAKMLADGAPVPVTPPPVSAETVSAIAQVAVPLGAAALQFAGQLAVAAVPAADGPPGGGAPITVPGSGNQGAEGRMPLTPATGAVAGPPGGAVLSGPGTSGTGAGGGGGAGAPSVRPVGLSGGIGGGFAVSPTEPALGSRPISAEPIGGATPSHGAAAPGWSRPVAGGAMGMPMAPLAPMGSSGGTRSSQVGRGIPFDSVPVLGGGGSTTPGIAPAGAAATGLPVLGGVTAAPVSVDVDFRLSDG